MTTSRDQSLARFDLAISALKKLDDAELGAISFTMPWQQDELTPSDTKDQDGFSISPHAASREHLQQACWKKFNENPHINTAVQGKVGRLTGLGFEISSDIATIQDVIEETELDPRNRLYCMWPKFVGRSFIEGELYLCCTLHDTGFVEVDFIDPSCIAGAGEDGIIYHPNKATMPLFYSVKANSTTTGYSLVPSIYIARYPELIKVAEKVDGFTMDRTNDSKSSKSRYKKIGGYRRFIISWDKSFMTKRNVSHLRTILEWLNHYENLKKYEIDHKKSAGSYLWVITMEDPKAFRTWMALSDEEKKKTGIMSKKTPGSTLILPPGMKIEVQNPSLPSISETDQDIFHMVTAGLNEAEDMTTGQSKGTFSSVKASRGPMSDRTSDEIAYFSRFLRHDFYGSIFFLKTMTDGFPAVFSVREAIDFKDQEPVFKNVKRRPEMLLDITFPVSETIDSEARARAYLGVKHGALSDVMGIPVASLAEKLGFGNYKRLRLKHATEKEKYPELAVAVDQEAINGQKGDGGDKKGDQKNPDAKPVLKRRVDVKKEK